MNLKPWQPGQSGNPAGRPKGSRHKLAEEFLRALQSDFVEHGEATIQAVRKTKPDQYLKVIASIMPREIDVKVSTTDELADDELAALIHAAREAENAAQQAGEGASEEGAGKPAKGVSSVH